MRSSVRPHRRNVGSCTDVMSQSQWITLWRHVMVPSTGCNEIIQTSIFSLNPPVLNPFMKVGMEKLDESAHVFLTYIARSVWPLGGDPWPQYRTICRPRSFVGFCLRRKWENKRKEWCHSQTSEVVGNGSLIVLAGQSSVASVWHQQKPVARPAEA